MTNYTVLFCKCQANFRQNIISVNISMNCSICNRRMLIDIFSHIIPYYLTISKINYIIINFHLIKVQTFVMIMD